MLAASEKKGHIFPSAVSSRPVSSCLVEGNRIGRILPFFVPHFVFLLALVLAEQNGISHTYICLS